MNSDRNISIHSLVKRETGKRWDGNGLTAYFNPLPRKEGDLCADPESRQTQSDFNPLPRKEGDFETGKGFAAAADFNPLPRKEGDQKKETTSPGQFVFQSTPS